MRKLIIAIDGPVGSGKSTVARRVAELLGYVYLDSGAMYRGVGWKALRDHVPLDSEDRVAALARATRIDLVSSDGGFRVLVDGTDVTNQIRSAAVAQAASKVAVIAGVRTVLVAEQRRAAGSGGVVMEGRDIGTVVFPDADLKIFLDASVEVRAERRRLEYAQKGESLEFSEVLKEVRQRDRRDRERAVSPLVRADDAVLVDNTAMSAEETARLIVFLAHEREAAATAAARVDQSGGHDGERSALFDIACGGEKAPRPLEGVGVNTAGKHFARRRRHRVISARQSRDGIQQDHHIALVFDQALGFFQDHFGHLDVALGGLIEGRADDLALYGSLHVRDFFRALIDQQHDQGDFRMIGGDGVGHRLQHHGFAGARRGHDQAALALADVAEQVENTAGEVLVGRLHFEQALRIERSEIIEKDFVPRYLGIFEVNGFHLNQREGKL